MSTWLRNAFASAGFRAPLHDQRGLPAPPAPDSLPLPPDRPDDSERRITSCPSSSSSSANTKMSTAAVVERPPDSYRPHPNLNEPLNLILSATMENVRTLCQQIKKIGRAIEREVRKSPITLSSIPGLGPVFIAGMLAEIQDINRFPEHALPWLSSPAFSGAPGNRAHFRLRRPSWGNRPMPISDTASSREPTRLGCTLLSTRPLLSNQPG